SSPVVRIPSEHVRLGDILLLQGRPSQVIRISTSAATGRHRYLGVDLFTGEHREESSFITHPVHAPEVTIHIVLGPVFKQYQLLDLAHDGAAVAMTETGNVRRGVRVLNSVRRRLTETFKGGKASILVLVVATNEDGEIIVDMKPV
ncbi:eukaryotic translation initiation factor-like protein 5A-1, partial [Echria macrotheca]